MKLAVFMWGAKAFVVCVKVETLRNGIKNRVTGFCLWLVLVKISPRIFMLCYNLEKSTQTLEEC